MASQADHGMQALSENMDRTQQIQRFTKMIRMISSIILMIFLTLFVANAIQTNKRLRLPDQTDMGISAISHALYVVATLSSLAVIYRVMAACFSHQDGIKLVWVFSFSRQLTTYTGRLVHFAALSVLIALIHMHAKSTNRADPSPVQSVIQRT